jgi:hypothetical protein
VRVEGGGLLGFGCGFMLALLVCVAIWLPTTRLEAAIILIVAVTIGVVAARYGDAFFTRALEKLRWIFWW